MLVNFQKVNKWDHSLWTVHGIEWTWWKIWIGSMSLPTVLSSFRCTSWRFTAKKTRVEWLRFVDMTTHHGCLFHGVTTTHPVHVQVLSVTCWILLNTETISYFNGTFTSAIRNRSMQVYDPVDTIFTVCHDDLVDPLDLACNKSNL